MLCTASVSNLYMFSVCGAANIDFLSHVNWLLWSGTEFWRITYDIEIPLAPTIIYKWPRSSIYHLYHCIADSNFTLKSSLIIASPFLFFCFLHYSHPLSSSIIVRSVGSSTSLNISVVYLSWHRSLAQYMSNTSSFCFTLVTTNIPFTRVLLVYPPHATWVPSASSSLRCPIPSVSINMSYWMPFLATCVLIPNIVWISSVVHLIGGASDASILLYLVSY